MKNIMEYLNENTVKDEKQLNLMIYNAFSTNKNCVFTIHYCDSFDENNKYTITSQEINQTQRICCLSLNNTVLYSGIFETKNTDPILEMIDREMYDIKFPVTIKIDGDIEEKVIENKNTNKEIIDFDHYDLKNFADTMDNLDDLFSDIMDMSIIEIYNIKYNNLKLSANTKELPPMSSYYMEKLYSYFMDFLENDKSDMMLLTMSLPIKDSDGVNDSMIIDIVVDKMVSNHNRWICITANRPNIDNGYLFHKQKTMCSNYYIDIKDSMDEMFESFEDIVYYCFELFQKVKNSNIIFSKEFKTELRIND